MHSRGTDQRPIAGGDGRHGALSEPAVLIGTFDTVRELIGQLHAVADPPSAVGCVLVEPVAESRRRHPVLGSIDDLPDLAGRLGLRLGVVSLPAAMGPTIRRVRAVLASLGMAERFVPPLSELLSRAPGAPSPGGHGPTTLDMEDLIGRTPHGIDRRAVARLIEGKRVLVTGAGGSIGSEICRIVATFRPERVLLMERSENALFEIDRRLARHFGGVARAAILHDVVDADRTLRLLVEHRPHLVFHAAAHKHVPLMEDHPSHAVENNFFGTKSIADASLATGVERFVMISSDKAVNPRSVMGATKRLAEMYVQGLHAQAATGGRGGPIASAPTAFCMVRFGNVLGSACSVLPIWTGQIAEGGPVTVTDPRMTRYFMTIHEAATLVIQAAAMTRPDSAGAGVFVLDMGEPVQILELSRRLVAACGFEPVVVGAGEAGADHATSPAGMEIRMTGARPGEKLHEELAYAAEQLAPTDHPGINLWAGDTESTPNLATLVAELSAVRATHDRRAVLEVIGRHIPTLISSGPERVIEPGIDSTAARPTKNLTSTDHNAHIDGVAA